MKKNPLRMCISCRQMLPKSDIIRVVKQKSGAFLVDSGGKLEGRGAYICKNNDCINKCITMKLLNKNFKGAVPKEIYDIISRSIIQD